jgi:hypothetical protein
MINFNYSSVFQYQLLLEHELSRMAESRFDESLLATKLACGNFTLFSPLAMNK